MKDEQLTEWFEKHRFLNDEDSHKICSLIYEIANLLDVVKEYDSAAQKFINKVDNGLARSVETYSDLKKALRHSKAILGEDD